MIDSRRPLADGRWRGVADSRVHQYGWNEQDGVAGPHTAPEATAAPAEAAERAEPERIVPERGAKEEEKE